MRNRILIIMPATLNGRMTAEGFARRFAQVPCCELQRGEVVHLSPGAWDHSAISFRIAARLGEWAARRKRGRVLTNEAGLITRRRPDTVRGMDVAFFSYQRVPRGQEPSGFATVAPELVVEIIGKGQGWKAMVEKAGEYLAVGVDRVWIVDPRRMTLHVFQADHEPIRLTARDTLRDAAVLPGFACRLAELFQD